MAVNPTNAVCAIVQLLPCKHRYYRTTRAVQTILVACGRCRDNDKSPAVGAGYATRFIWAVHNKSSTGTGPSGSHDRCEPVHRTYAGFAICLVQLIGMWLPRFLTNHRAFISNVAAMMSGKTIAAVIALFTMPIVARLFSPSDFGVAASFLSVIGIVSSPASLRYETALVLPKVESEATELLALANRILLFVCLLMVVFLAIYDIAGFRWPFLELLGSWMWLLPLGVLLTAGLQIQESWLARQEAFKLVAASTALGSAVTSGVRLIAGFVSGTTVIGLIGGNLLGLLGRFILQKTATLSSARATFSRIDLSETRRIASHYSDFPRLNAPAGLINALGQNLPVLLFGVMYAPAVAGFYAMANRLSQVPISIVANSVRRVFLQKAAAINNRNASLSKAFFLATGGLAVAGILPFGCLWFFGQPLLEWLLGERWHDAGRYLEIMAPWLLMLWITAPSNPVFVVLRKQHVWLTMQVWLTFLRLAAFGLAYVWSAGPEWALQAFVVATVAGNLVTIGVAGLLISRDATNHPRTV